jgi:DNA-directed RNA polymerase subunit RPC12/RpoP
MKTEDIIVYSVQTAELDNLREKMVMEEMHKATIQVKSMLMIINVKCPYCDHLNEIAINQFYEEIECKRCMRKINIHVFVRGTSGL